MYRKEAYIINDDGFIIGIDTVNLDELGNILDEHKKHMIPIGYQGLYKAKWNGQEWIEGASQEEIDEMTKVEPLPPTDTEILGQQMTEREIESMIQGQQITDMELRLIMLEAK